jgi:hypothetical protein
MTPIKPQPLHYMEKCFLIGFAALLLNSGAFAADGSVTKEFMESLFPKDLCLASYRKNWVADNSDSYKQCGMLPWDSEEYKKLHLPVDAKILAKLRDEENRDYYLIFDSSIAKEGRWYVYFKLIRYSELQSEELWLRTFQEDPESGGCGRDAKRGLVTYEAKTVSTKNAALIFKVMNCESRSNESEAVYFAAEDDFIRISEDTQD